MRFQKSYFAENETIKQSMKRARLEEKKSVREVFVHTGKVAAAMAMLYLESQKHIAFVVKYRLHAAYERH